MRNANTDRLIAALEKLLETSEQLGESYRAAIKSIEDALDKHEAELRKGRVKPCNAEDTKK